MGVKYLQFYAPVPYRGIKAAGETMTAGGLADHIRREFSGELPVYLEASDAMFSHAGAVDASDLQQCSEDGTEYVSVYAGLTASSPEDAGETMTAEELADFLDREFNADLPVYLEASDTMFSYAGPVTKWNLEEADTEDDA